MRAKGIFVRYLAGYDRELGVENGVRSYFEWQKQILPAEKRLSASSGCEQRRDLILPAFQLRLP